MATLPDVKIRLVLENGQLRAGLSGAQGQFNQFAQSVTGNVNQAVQSIASLDQRVQGLTQTMDTLQSVGATVLTFAGIKAALGSLIDAQLRLQEIKYGLDAATGSATLGAQEFQYLSETADRVGVRLLQAGQAYAGYLVAAKAANLTTAESRNLFTAVSEAGAVFNLSQERMGAAMLALQQMMGQGVIRSQELQYQLGSALPGSFSKFKALVEDQGIDFQKALSKGQLDVKTFAPILTQAISSLYSEEALKGAANDLNSQLAKMENSIVRFKQSFTEGQFTEFLSTILGTSSKAIESIADLNKEMGGTIAIYATVAVAVAAAVKSINLIVGKAREYASAFREAVIVTRDGARLEAQAAAQREAAALAQAEATKQSLAMQQLELQVQRDKLLLSEATLAAKEAEAAANVAAAEAAALNGQGQAGLLKSQAALTAVQNERALVQARLNGLTTQGTVIAAEAVTVENARLQAEVRLGEALVARTIAEGRVATTTEAAAIASGVAARNTLAQAAASGAATGALTAQAAATTLLTTASAALATVGRGLLALMGGLPGLAIAAGAGLIYLATRATEAEKSIRELGQSITETEANFKSLVKLNGEYTKFRQELVAANEAFKKDPTEANREALIRSNENFKRTQDAIATSGKTANDVAFAQAQRRIEAEKQLQSLLSERGKLQDDLKKKEADGTLQGDRVGQAILRQARNDLSQKESEIAEATKNLQRAREAEARDAAAARSQSRVAQQAQQGLASSQARVEASKLVRDAITSSEAAIQAAKEKTATVEEKVKSAQAATLAEYRKQAATGNVSPAQRAQDEKVLLDAVEKRVRAEETSTRTTKVKSTVDRDAARAARELERADDATARGEERLQELTRQGIDGQRRANAIRDQMEASLRQVSDAVADATKAINDSKIAEDEKTERLKKITEAADKAKDSIRDLAAFQREQAARDIRLATEEDIFQAQNSELARSSDPRQQDQAERDRINREFDLREDELNESLGDDTSSAEYQSGLANLQAARSAALDAMVTETEQRAQEMEDAMVGSMTNTITGILTGAVTLKQGLLQMFSEILRMYIQKMVAEPLAQAAMRWARETALGKMFMTQQILQQTQASTAVTGIKEAESTAAVTSNAATAASGAAASQASIPYVGPVLAIAAMVAMLAAVMAIKRKNKATGGLISGPGTGTSDDVPINASNGEYMIKAASVKKYGTGFLDSVNQGRLQRSPINDMRKVHGYADGGLINPQGPIQSTPGGVQEGDRAGPGVRVINVMDPRLLEDYVNSPQGERVIMNVIEKNPRKVKQMIG